VQLSSAQLIAIESCNSYIIFYFSFLHIASSFFLQNTFSALLELESFVALLAVRTPLFGTFPHNFFTESGNRACRLCKGVYFSVFSNFPLQLLLIG